MSSKAFDMFETLTVDCFIQSMMHLFKRIDALALKIKNMNVCLTTINGTECGVVVYFGMDINIHSLYG